MSTPSLKEIEKAHSYICDQNDRCGMCPIYASDSCYVGFIYDVLTGKRGLDGKLIRKDKWAKVPSKDAKSILPKWFVIGQWVRYGAGEEYRLGKILGIDDEDNSKIRVEAHSTLGLYTPEEEFISIHNVFYPVNFREYTDEEAKTLVGKYFDFKDGGRAMLLEYSPDDVLPYKFRVEYLDFKELSTIYGATIAGIPVGVPEILQNDINP